MESKLVVKKDVCGRQPVATLNFHQLETLKTSHSCLKLQLSHVFQVKGMLQGYFLKKS